MRTRQEVEWVLALAESGENDCQISRATRIPRSTVQNWTSGRTPDLARAGSCACFRCSCDSAPLRALAEYSYAYLLGLYLGDGCLLRHARVMRLNITLDRAYPGIVAEAAAAAALAMPCSKASVYSHPVENWSAVNSYSKYWPCLFPQHGPGVKHERKIVLEPWQLAICDRYPERLLRGLIHSDGYRGINTIRHPKKTYRYPRYQFTNHSDDIRGIFCEYCDRLGIEWRRMNRWNISVARRDSVAAMDRFIGPKR